MYFEKIKQNYISWLPVFILIITTASIYGVTAQFDLLNTLDDKYYLILNDTIKGFSVSNIKSAFTDYYIGNYAPIHIISYMIDYSLWNLNPAGYHLENVLIHILNGLLFYKILRHLSISKWQCVAAAWIFLLHPVQVETVAWVSQRKNLLAMFFFLLSFSFYQSYIENKQHKIGFYIFSIISITASMLSKSVAVIFPIIILLYDYFYLGIKNKKLKVMLLDKLPYIMVAVIVALMAIISQSEDIGGGRRDFPGGSPLSTFFTMTPVLLSYIRDCFYPFEISPYYMTTIRQQPDFVFISSLAVLCLVFGFGVSLYFKNRFMLFWFALFFVALLPVLQIVPLITLKNDRYLYFPLLGFSVFVVHFAMKLKEIMLPTFGKIFHGLLLAIMLLIPLFTYKQTLAWQNDLTLWSRAVEADSENRLAWLQLAKSYTDKKDSVNAIRSINRYNELKNKYGPVRGFEN